MADRISPDVHEIALVGTTTRSARPVPAMGTWESSGTHRAPGTATQGAHTGGAGAALPRCATSR